MTNSIGFPQHVSIGMELSMLSNTVIEHSSFDCRISYCLFVFNKYSCFKGPVPRNNKKKGDMNLKVMFLAMKHLYWI